MNLNQFRLIILFLSSMAVGLHIDSIARIGWNTNSIIGIACALVGVIPFFLSLWFTLRD